ncbi:UNKNOWN [Stylonychia lemnae]|uniref:Uncharacterized protein n=1 Tax=Stylonychia lemnae TaxID=5949 RepID=A0A078AMK5_STYLE|nr:UNKNOWN [Stylonychia lemnae]|eukprot:CDW82098.1 UNKNOWN [Stylonychia lemnae]
MVLARAFMMLGNGISFALCTQEDYLMKIKKRYQRLLKFLKKNCLIRKSMLCLVKCHQISILDLTMVRIQRNSELFPIIGADGGAKIRVEEDWVYFQKCLGKKKIPNFHLARKFLKQLKNLPPNEGWWVQKNQSSQFCDENLKETPQCKQEL